MYLSIYLSIYPSMYIYICIHLNEVRWRQVEAKLMPRYLDTDPATRIACSFAQVISERRGNSLKDRWIYIQIDRYMDQ